MTSSSIPAHLQAVHPSAIIGAELEARGWSRDYLAQRMGGDFGINRLALDFYFTCGPTDPNLRIGDAAEALAAAFDVAPEFFQTLEVAWLEKVQVDREGADDDR